jgi:hypothetical protein
LSKFQNQSWVLPAKSAMRVQSTSPEPITGAVASATQYCTPSIVAISSRQ